MHRYIGSFKIWHSIVKRISNREQKFLKKHVLMELLFSLNLIHKVYINNADIQLLWIIIPTNHKAYEN
jgi:hypothetical protein